MRIDKNNICPHGEIVWVDGKDKETGTAEFKKGTFLRIYCNAQCTWCSMEDYHECIIYIKREKE